MAKKPINKKLIISLTSAGGALEMYDFVIYIFFAGVIAKSFFPLESHYASMLSTFAVFATGYLFRPIGGLIFGHMGDRYGRQKGLVLTIILMGISIVGMALMPTYHQIGLAAPILFCFFRSLQGIALGGDLPGGITFINEYADIHERGLLTGVFFLCINIGLLLASVVGALCVNLLSPEQVMSWGWRAAFLAGILLFFVGYYLRSKRIETPIFQKLLYDRESDHTPLKSLFKKHKLNLLRGISMMALHGIIVVQLFLFMPIFLHDSFSIEMGEAINMNTISLLLFSLCIPLVGWLSDRVGRNYLLKGVAAATLMLTFPLYDLIAWGYPWVALIGFAIIATFAVGTIPATLPELFPTAVRNSGIGVAYNVGFGVFGGLSPMIATYLIHYFGNPMAVGIDLAVAALVMLLFLFSAPLQKNHSLWE